MSAPACTNSQLDELEGPKVKLTLPASGFDDVVVVFCHHQGGYFTLLFK